MTAKDSTDIATVPENFTPRPIIRRIFRGSPQGRAGGLLFGVALLAMILMTHGRMSNEGYEGEVFRTVSALVENHRPGFALPGETKLYYYRNGLSQPLLSLPFYYIGIVLQNWAKPLFSREWAVQLFMPVVTALTVLYVYRFALLLGHTLRRAALLGLLAAFGTMLFPYSIFGMEPLQTFLALAAAFYLYRYRRTPAWWAIGMAGLAVALLYPAKRASPIVVVPLLLYALFVLWQYRQRWRDLRLTRDVALFALPLILSFAANAWFNSLKPASTTNQFHIFNDGLITSGVLGYLFSLGKSYFLYSPVALLALFGLRGFWRQHRAETLLFGGLIVTCWLFFAEFHFWADETWGPRYLHVITPFAVLLIGGIFPLQPRTAGLRWWREGAGRTQAAIIGLLGAGVIVNFLGSIFYYGDYAQILTEARANTFANMQYDPDLNNIWLNLLVVASGITKTLFNRPILFVYRPNYWPTTPPDVKSLDVTRTIDLSRFANCDLWVCKVATQPDYPIAQKIVGLGLWTVLAVLLLLAAWRLWQTMRRTAP